MGNITVTRRQHYEKIHRSIHGLSYPEAMVVLYQNLTVASRINRRQATQCHCGAMGILSVDGIYYCQDHALGAMTAAKKHFRGEIASLVEQIVNVRMENQ